VAAAKSAAAGEAGTEAQARAAAEWGCPKCRHGYPGAAVPCEYLCFCGKQEDPEWDPWVTPHSCAELCGRALPGGCGHACLLLW
jgi:NF-X1-type zinc finger protein NFXL1